MELKDFVEGTITQVIEGVSAAQKACEKGDATVAPGPGGGHFALTAPSIVASKIPTLSSGHPLTMLDFDVALTVTEGSATKGGAGIAIGVLALGTQGQSSMQNSSVSRIKFAVPIVLPTQEIDRANPADKSPKIARGSRSALRGGLDGF